MRCPKFAAMLAIADSFAWGSEQPAVSRHIAECRTCAELLFLGHLLCSADCWDDPDSGEYGPDSPRPAG